MKCMKIGGDGQDLTFLFRSMPEEVGVQSGPTYGSPVTGRVDAEGK
jgi:hypothetical protein